jgi:hypothetical protein
LQKEKKRVSDNQKDRQIKKKTLHKWTPDSAELLDAYLSVGYGSNIGGVLQCAN